MSTMVRTTPPCSFHTRTWRLALALVSVFSAAAIRPLLVLDYGKSRSADISYADRLEGLERTMRGEDFLQHAVHDLPGSYPVVAAGVVPAAVTIYTDAQFRRPIATAEEGGGAAAPQHVSSTVRAAPQHDRRTTPHSAAVFFGNDYTDLLSHHVALTSRMSRRALSGLKQRIKEATVHDKTEREYCFRGSSSGHWMLPPEVFREQVRGLLAAGGASGSDRPAPSGAPASSGSGCAGAKDDLQHLASEILPQISRTDLPELEAFVQALAVLVDQATGAQQERSTLFGDEEGEEDQVDGKTTTDHDKDSAWKRLLDSGRVGPRESLKKVFDGMGQWSAHDRLAGTRVQIQGLVGKPELNNRVGVIRADKPDDAAHRLSVELLRTSTDEADQYIVDGDEKKKAIRPENLFVAPVTLRLVTDSLNAIRLVELELLRRSCSDGADGFDCVGLRAHAADNRRFVGALFPSARPLLDSFFALLQNLERLLVEQIGVPMQLTLEVLHVPSGTGLNTEDSDRVSLGNWAADRLARGTLDRRPSSLCGKRGPRGKKKTIGGGSPGDHLEVTIDSEKMSGSSVHEDAVVVDDIYFSPEPNSAGGLAFAHAPEQIRVVFEAHRERFLRGGGAGRRRQVSAGLRAAFRAESGKDVDVLTQDDHYTEERDEERRDSSSSAEEEDEDSSELGGKHDLGEEDTRRPPEDLLETFFRTLREFASALHSVDAPLLPTAARSPSYTPAGVLSKRDAMLAALEALPPSVRDDSPFFVEEHGPGAGDDHVDWRRAATGSYTVRMPLPGERPNASGVKSQFVSARRYALHFLQDWFYKSKHRRQKARLSAWGRFGNVLTKLEKLLSSISESQWDWAKIEIVGPEVPPLKEGETNRITSSREKDNASTPPVRNLCLSHGRSDPRTPTETATAEFNKTLAHIGAIEKSSRNKPALLAEIRRSCLPELPEYASLIRLARLSLPTLAESLNAWRDFAGGGGHIHGHMKGILKPWLAEEEDKKRWNLGVSDEEKERLRAKMTLLGWVARFVIGGGPGADAPSPVPGPNPMDVVGMNMTHQQVFLLQCIGHCIRNGQELTVIKKEGPAVAPDDLLEAAQAHGPAMLSSEQVPEDEDVPSWDGLRPTDDFRQQLLDFLSHAKWSSLQEERERERQDQMATTALQAIEVVRGGPSRYNPSCPTGGLVSGGTPAMTTSPLAVRLLAALDDVVRDFGNGEWAAPPAASTRQGGVPGRAVELVALSTGRRFLAPVKLARDKLGTLSERVLSIIEPGELWGGAGGGSSVRKPSSIDKKGKKPTAAVDAAAAKAEELSAALDAVATQMWSLQQVCSVCHKPDFQKCGCLQMEACPLERGKAICLESFLKACDQKTVERGPVERAEISAARSWYEQILYERVQEVGPAA